MLVYGVGFGTIAHSSGMGKVFRCAWAMGVAVVSPVMGSVFLPVNEDNA